MKVHDQIPFPIQGVSQQPAHVRADGRVEDQLNMLSDPVRGLVRRQGSEYVDMASTSHAVQLSATDVAALAGPGWRQVRAQVGARDCTIWYSTLPITGSHAVLAYDHTANQWFAPWQLTEFVLASEQFWPALTSTGVASLTVIDGTVFLAAVGRPAGAYQYVRNLLNDSRDYGVDIVAGMNGRTYKVTLHTTTGVFVGSYTVPGLEYPVAIDLTHRSTADGGGPLSPTDSIYTQLVMAVQAEYDNAARAWKSDAIEKARPSYIARELALALAASGLPSGISVFAPLTHSSEHGFAVHDSNGGQVLSVEVSDGGNGDAIRCASKTLQDVADLPRIGTDGISIVKVVAKDGTDPVYYRAVPAEGSTALRHVTWVEATSSLDYHTTTLFSWKLDEGIIIPVEGGNQFGDGSVPTSPTYTVFRLTGRSVGDLDTAPTPDFLTKPITYLGTHQDRLLIGVGNRLFASRSGDWLNFYRTTVHSVNDDDPFTVAAELAQDDTIRDGLYNGRDLFLFGDKFQYVLSGRTTLTPHNAVLPKVGREDNTAQAHPALVGDKLYFTRGTSVSEVLMLAPSDTVDASKAVSLTQHLEDFIGGAPRRIVGVHQPSMLAVLAGDPHTMYVYQMLDTQDQGRVQTAWHRFTYHPSMGALFGMGYEPHGLVLFFATQVGSAARIEAVRQPLRPILPSTGRAYLDGQRTLARLPTDTAGMHWAVTVGQPQDYQGGPITGAARYPAHIAAVTPEAGIVYGYPFQAYVVPTQPYRKGSDGVKLTAAPTVVASYSVSVSDSWQLLADGKMRWAGVPRTNDGRAVPAKALITVPHGKPADKLLRLAAGPYSPLRITALAWTGQVFWRTQR